MDLAALLKRLRASFDARRTRPLEWRYRQLDGLRRMLEEREADFIRALQADLHRPELEAWAAEVGFVVNEADFTRKRLRRWLRPERVWTPAVDQPGKSRIIRDPLGVVLIFGAWNYPVHLSLSPLVGAIAAGNCAVVKPSELSPESSAVMARLLPDYVDAECVAVVEGGPDVAAQLLEHRFDYLFYTGGEKVGRIVMEKAATHLTPVTLELGGKCPCYIDRDVDMEIACRRVAWGKFMNAGQTCVAPDYALVDTSRVEEFIDGVAKCARDFYGPDPRQSPDYSRIVNDRHFDRVSRLLTGGVIASGGDVAAEDRYIAPTILRDVSCDDPVMKEEIFGPVLPVIAVRDLDEAINFVATRPKPLALYVFSRDKTAAQEFIERTSSGAVCVNEVVNHLVVPGLPFGGVGTSGMGAYHGRHTFETFSHRKSVYRRWSRPDLSLRYPPYDARKLRWLRRLL